MPISTPIAVALGAGILGVYEAVARPVAIQIKDALYSNPAEQSG